MRARLVRCALLLLTAAALVSCGGGGQPTAGPEPASPRASVSATAEPAASPTAARATATPSESAFCRDLNVFNIAQVMYAAEVGKALMGQPVDFKEARRIARLIAQYGKAMEDSVPPDIADAFHSQVKAVRKSSSKLSTDSKVRDVTDPVYSDKAQARQKKLDEYECG